MSLWEQLLKDKVAAFWLKLIAVSFLLHFIVLLFVFLKKGSKVNFDISTSSLIIDYPLKVNPMKKRTLSGLSQLEQLTKKVGPRSLSKKGFVPNVSKISLQKRSNLMQIPKLNQKGKVVDKAGQAQKKIVASVEKLDLFETKLATNIPKPLEIGRYDLTEIQLYKILHLRISKNFSPPKGMPKDARCVVNIWLDKTGRIKRLEIEKSSGVLAFDIAAKNAANATKYPPQVWNNEVSLNFKVEK